MDTGITLPVDITKTPIAFLSFLTDTWDSGRGSRTPGSSITIG
jgi:hypothetical protein